MSQIGDEFISTSTEDFGYKSLGGPIQLVPDYEEFLPFRHLNNLASAPHAGVFVAAAKDKIILGTIQDLKKDIINEESSYTSNRHELTFEEVMSVSFTKDEKTLVVTSGNTIHHAPFADYKSLTSSDFQSISLDAAIDLAVVSPVNPSTLAVLDTQGQLFLLDISTGSQSPIAQEVTYFSWSPKGKQIAIASKDNTIKQITLSGDVKVTITMPEDLADEGVSPISLVWISPFKFLAIFGDVLEETEEDPSYDFKAFIITHDKASGQNTFEENFDIVPAFGTILRKPTLYSSTFHNLSQSLPILTIVGSSTSVEISGLGNAELFLPESDAARAALPINDDTGNDVNAIGLITDISETGKIEEPCQGVSEANWLPTIWVLGNDGKVQGWYLFHVHDLKNGSFKSERVKEYDDALYKTALEGSGSTTTSPAKPPAPVEQKPTETRPAFGASPFGAPQTDSTKPAFGASPLGAQSTDSKPAFGNTAFGQSNFGQSTFGQQNTSSKPAFGSSGFGQSSFGSTSNTDNKSPFGSTTFGKTSPDKPAFGSSGFGQSSFGSTSNTDNKSPFGSTTFGKTSPDKPAFGSSTFGKTSPDKPAFGSSGFGQTFKPAAKPAFGSPVSSSKPAPAFGAGSGFGQSASNNSPFASMGKGESPFGTLPSKDSPFGGSSNKDSPFSNLLNSNNNESPFGASSKKESPFASIGLDKPNAPIAKNETSSLFSGGNTKETPQSSLFGGNSENKKSDSPFASMTGDLGSSLFGANEPSKVPVPGLSDEENDDNSSEEVEDQDSDVEETQSKPVQNTQTNQFSGPTSFGSSGPTSFGSNTGPTSFGSSGFGSAGFGNTGFGNSGFKFGQKPQQPSTNEGQDKKIEKPAFGGFGQFATANKLSELSEKKSIFDTQESKSEAKDETASVQEPEQEPERESEPELEDDEDADEEEEEEEEEEESFEGETEEPTSGDFHRFDEEEIQESWSGEGEDYEEENTADEEEEDEEDYDNDNTEGDDQKDEEADKLSENIDEALRFNEADPDTDENLNIDEEEDAPKADDKEDDGFEDIKGEESRDTSSLDSYKDKEDEAIYKELQQQQQQQPSTSNSNVQTERAPQVDHGTQRDYVSKDQAISAVAEVKEISVQTDEIQKKSIALQTFEDDELYLGLQFIPKEVPQYKHLGSVKYPSLNSDPVFSQLEKIYYDTQAEISIIEENCKNMGEFIDDHLKTEPELSEVSLSRPLHWRLSQASRFRDLLKTIVQEGLVTKSDINHNYDAIKDIQETIETMEKKSTTIREKFLSIEKLTDKAILNARDLPLDVLMLQDKLRKDHAQVTKDLRSIEQKIMTLKTTTNVFHNDAPTPGVLHSIINHINSVTRDYSIETKELSEQIAKLNINHNKILQKLHEGKNKSFNESEWEHRSLTKIKIADLNKKLSARSQINQALRERPVKTVTIRL